MKERPILFSGAMVRAILAGRKTQTRRVMKSQPVGELRPLAEWSRRTAGACGDHSPSAAALAEHGARLSGRVFPFLRPDGIMLSPTCPFGQPGDRLWVRETWGFDDTVRIDFKPFGPRDLSGMDLPIKVRYLADGAESRRWRPSIHMPRWASRITLEVASVRVERLQDITEEDAKAEGALFAIDEEQTYFNPELTDERNTGCVACGGDPAGIAELCHPLMRGQGRPHACWFATLWDSINGKREGAAWASNPWVWVVEFKRIPEETRRDAASRTVQKVEVRK